MRADPTPRPDTPDHTSPGLLVAGFLMTVAIFMIGNPMFGIHRVWPWQLATDVPETLLARTLQVMWMVTGVALLLLAFTRAYRFRSTLALIVGAVLVLNLRSASAGFVAERFGLAETLAVAGIGAGFLLVRRRSTRGPGRALALLAAVAYLAGWFIGFVGSTPRIEIYLHDLREALAGGTAYLTAAHEPGLAWHTLVPQTLLFVAALGALAVGCGVRARPIVTLLFWVAVAGVAMPLGTRVVRIFFVDDPELVNVATQLVKGLIGDGVALWVLIVCGIGDLTRPDPDATAWEAA